MNVESHALNIRNVKPSTGITRHAGVQYSLPKSPSMMTSYYIRTAITPIQHIRYVGVVSQDYVV